MKAKHLASGIIKDIKPLDQKMFGHYLQNIVSTAINSIADSASKVKASPSPDKRKTKTHDYRRYDRGIHYVFESTDDGLSGYMTAQGNNIQQGEYVLLPDEDCKNCCLYQVEQIDYYSNPSDMWIAKLQKVPLEKQP